MQHFKFLTEISSILNHHWLIIGITNLIAFILQNICHRTLASTKGRENRSCHAMAMLTGDFSFHNDIRGDEGAESSLLSTRVSCEGTSCTAPAELPLLFQALLRM
jgi:hypothetical protein